MLLQDWAHLLLLKVSAGMSLGQRACLSPPGSDLINPPEPVKLNLQNLQDRSLTGPPTVQDLLLCLRTTSALPRGRIPPWGSRDCNSFVPTAMALCPAPHITHRALPAPPGQTFPLRVPAVCAAPAMRVGARGAGGGGGRSRSGAQAGSPGQWGDFEPRKMGFSSRPEPGVRR